MTLVLADTNYPRPKQKTVFSIQVLRGIATVLVVIVHAFMFGHEKESVTTFQNGAAGVDIFFAISGVVIYLTGPLLTPNAFFIRRLARVVPLFWFFLTLKLGLILSTNMSHRFAYVDPLYVLQSYLFIPAYDQDGNVFPLMTVGWTLNFEMYFYIVSAICLVAGSKNFLKSVSTVILAGVLCGLAFSSIESPRPPAVTLILSPISIEFVGGMFVAWLWTNGVRIPRSLTILLLCIGILWISMVPYQQAYSPLRIFAWGIPALTIVWCFLSLEDQFPFHALKFPLLLGDASYSIYLLHTSIIPVAGGVLRKVAAVPTSVSVTLMIVTAIAAGVVLHLVLEAPVNRAIGNLLRMRRRKVSSAIG